MHTSASETRVGERDRTEHKEREQERDIQNRKREGRENQGSVKRDVGGSGGEV